MRDVNKLDAKGLRNLGIDFNIEDEMDRFATLIRDEMEMRVGDELTRVMTQKQINDFESIMGNDSLAQVEWIRENCPEHREICERVKNELREELLRFKKEIPGLKKNAELEWNGKSVGTFENLSLRALRLLEAQGVRTFGELYSMDEADLVHVLGEENRDYVVKMKEILKRNREYCLQYDCAPLDLSMDEELLIDDYYDEDDIWL